ncbi:MAG: hypothetical protein KAR42_15260 [candidate division Zixibacteria bacterium]|nr:hypothetical protein [candidate division Zixibacteria bacterium]
MINRFIISVMVPFVFLFNLSIARAEDITFGSLLKFSSGIITSFMIHESAHAFTADLNGIDLNWHTGTYDQPLTFTVYNICDSDGGLLYSSGLISQIVGSEIILRSKKIDKNSAYIRGMMAWNIINPISYSLNHKFIKHSNREAGNQFQGDIEGVGYYSSDSTANRFAIVMTGLAVYQGSRYLKTQDWFKGDSHSLSFGIQPSGGVGFNYKFWF